MTGKVTESETPRSKKQLADEAVAAAIAGDWERATALNRELIAVYGPDEEACNRLGKALTELGDVAGAREAYAETLKLNPVNPIALKNQAKLAAIGDTPLPTSRLAADPNLFVEEIGKSMLVTFKPGEDLTTRVSPGDVAELVTDAGGLHVAVVTARGVNVGSVDLKLARRLLQLMEAGNRYQAGITSVSPGQVKVILKEVYRHPSLADTPSFPTPGTRRDSDFRPYARASLLEDLGDEYGYDEDEDESELLEDDESEGMHFEDEETAAVFEDDDAEPALGDEELDEGESRDEED